MRKLAIGMAFSVVACRSENRAAGSQTRLDTSRDSLQVAVRTAADSSPGIEAAIIDTVPSSAVTAYDDSVIASAVGTHPVVTGRGDTIQYVGGTGLYVDSTREYASEEYRKNDVHYFRVALQMGNLPDGKPIMVTKARVRLPELRPDEELILGSLCRINKIDDPRVIAIATFPTDTTFGPAHYAWRFDPVTETLSGIPATNVSCGRIMGED